MCGLFGFEGEAADPDVLLGAVQEAARRGPHAWGVARLQAGRIGVRRYVGPVDQALVGRLLQESPGPLIGQTRLATSGDWQDPENNQPVLTGAVALAHNGTVPDARELAAWRRILLRTGCDSEVIAILTDGALRRGTSVGGALEWAMEIAGGQRHHAILLLTETGVLPYRRGHPLYALTLKEGTYWCSRPWHPLAELLPEWPHSPSLKCSGLTENGSGPTSITQTMSPLLS